MSDSNPETVVLPPFDERDHAAAQDGEDPPLDDRDPASLGAEKWAAAWNWRAAKADCLGNPLVFSEEEFESAAKKAEPHEAWIDAAWIRRPWGGKWEKIAPHLTPLGLGRLLRQAACDASPETLQELLKIGVDAKTPISSLGSTALMAAAMWRRWDCMETLLPLSEPLRINQVGCSALSALCQADMGLEDAARRMDMASRLAPNKGLLPGESPLLMVASSNKALEPNRQLLEFLIERYDVFAVNEIFGVEHNALSRSMVFGSDTHSALRLAEAMAHQRPELARDQINQAARNALSPGKNVEGLGYSIEKRFLPLDALSAAGWLDAKTEEGIVEAAKKAGDSNLAAACFAACERRALLAEIERSLRAEPAAEKNKAKNSPSAPSRRL